MTPFERSVAQAQEHLTSFLTEPLQLEALIARYHQAVPHNANYAAAVQALVNLVRLGIVKPTVKDGVTHYLRVNL